MKHLNPAYKSAKVGVLGWYEPEVEVQILHRSGPLGKEDDGG